MQKDKNINYIIKKLSVIEEQIKGINKMLLLDISKEDILVQIAKATRELKQVGIAIIRQNTPKELEKSAISIMKMYDALNK